MDHSGDFIGKRFDVGCTIEIENTMDSFHAYVELDGEIDIHPGDAVLVHGDEVIVPYGEKRTLRRVATVTRANAIKRAWTQMTGDLGCAELFEMSFSSGRAL